MKLRGKLALGFSVIIVLNIILAGVIYDDVNNTKSNLDEIVDSATPATERIEELRTSFIDLVENQDNLRNELAPFMAKTEAGTIDFEHIEFEYLEDTLGLPFTYVAEYRAMTDELDKLLSDLEGKLNENFVALSNETTGMASDNLNLIIALNIVLAIVAIIIALLLARVIVTPIRKLTLAANEIGDGNVDATTPEIKSNDEVRDLADSIDMMREAVRFMKNQKE